MTTIC